MSDMAKERPILMNGDMVRAILRDENRKNQTRRPVTVMWAGKRIAPDEPRFCDCDGVLMCEDECGDWYKAIDWLRCPFGVPGDQLYVRETFCIETNYETGSKFAPPFTDGRPVNWVDDEDFSGRYWQQCHYLATDPTPELNIGEDPPGVRWSPSVHMPRWASRITLEVTDVRVERVQDISDGDCCDEGLAAINYYVDGGSPEYEAAEHAQLGGLSIPEGSCERHWFHCLWDRCNKPGFKWADNPFCWAMTFKRVKGAANGAGKGGG